MEDDYFHISPWSVKRRGLLCSLMFGGRGEGGVRRGMGRQLEALSCVEERKPRPITNPGDNWSGGDGERQQLENALTKNIGLAMGQAPLRTDS